MEVVFRDELLAGACNKRELGDQRWGRFSADVRLAIACIAAAPQIDALLRSGVVAEHDSALVFRGQGSDVRIEHRTEADSGALAVLNVMALERGVEL